jgi:hypothetical protein
MATDKEPEQGYMTSYTLTFQIEGVSREKALEVARVVRARLREEVPALVEDAAVKAGAYRDWNITPVAQRRGSEPKVLHVRVEDSPFGLEDYDVPTGPQLSD